MYGALLLTGRAAGAQRQNELQQGVARSVVAAATLAPLTSAAWTARPGARSAAALDTANSSPSTRGHHAGMGVLIGAAVGGLSGMAIDASVKSSSAHVTGTIIPFTVVLGALLGGLVGLLLPAR